MTDNSKWIGTDARKLPDGSVAWVSYRSSVEEFAFLRIVIGGKLFRTGRDHSPSSEDSDSRPATVIAIVKLGEERPKTFADVPEYEAWEDGNGTLHWKSLDGEMCFAGQDGLVEVNYPSEPEEYEIERDMHRVGVVTGICVDGKPWPFKD